MFLQISGDKDEEQLLIAGKHYLNRPGFLESILNDLYNQLKQGPAHNFGATLDIILLSMDRYPGEKVCQNKSVSHFHTKCHSLFYLKILREYLNFADDSDSWVCMPLLRLAL